MLWYLTFNLDDVLESESGKCARAHDSKNANLLKYSVLQQDIGNGIAYVIFT